MRMDPISRGIGEILGLVAFLAVIFAFAFRGLGHPSPDLMYAIAQVGITIVLGYLVEAVWLANSVDRDDDHEKWLGGMVGFAIAGLLGVAAALIVGAHLAAGHDSFVDYLGLGWSVSSLILLGTLVVMHPWAVDRQRLKREGKSPS